ncbi:MAG: hypothetical protein ACRBBJ_12630 [Rhodomicrobiaceae bacterium]
MLKALNFTKSSIAMLFILLQLLAPTQAKANIYFIEFSSEQKNSTFVTYQTDPDHYDVAGNATRTCGSGYNPMDKRHSQNHQYKRPHTHPYVPWRQGCEK